MGRSRASTIGLAATAILLAACTTTVPVSPHDVGAIDEAEWLVVAPSGRSSFALRDVSVDTGFLSGATEAGTTREIPVDSIESVRMEHQDITALFALIPVAAVAIWLQHGVATAPDPPPSESCPFVYVHDGRGLVFQAEPYGGAIVPALERTEWTPLPDLRAVDGEYRLRIANELDETQHIDEARLVVVDHPAGTRVAADPYGEIHGFRDPVPPTDARDSRGRDLTAVLRETDRRAWLSSYDSMDAGTRETLRDPLVLEFPKPRGARTARLLVNGATSLWGARVARDFLALRGRDLPAWYDELDTSGPALLALLDWFGREGLYLLPIEVETPDGWEEREALFGSGPFAYKTTAYAIDVSDLPGETLRLRLRVPVNFWVLNSVAVDYSEPPPIQATDVQTLTHRDGRGRDTRVLLSAADDRELVMSERGDHVDLVYPVPARAGGDRTVFLKITGYYDIHLAAEGEPEETVLRRVLTEPGYTLRFAFEQYLSTGRSDRTGTR